ncbi:MAG: biotin carboxylase N-terminal domain-containing protein [Acidimicrobiales bacterium]|jgi:propionyl-CoA carboxylase alpha chain
MTTIEQPDGRDGTGAVTSLLVANRGEIARRVMRTARAMGITTVAVHSDADARSPHVAEADLAVHLPGVSPADTYLRHDLLLDAARRSGADAVHPGYGFLSESGDFARAVIEAGLIWVGPPPAAIDAMGSKIGAKEMMRAAGVPTLPSVTVDGDTPPDGDRVAELGFPLLVKASAGGGGRGMRIVDGPDDLAEALAGARREALSAFGDGTVFLERYITSPRHIEVQVLADAHGDVVALFERECSIQRRHQKIIEEAPSPVVGPALRARLSEAAVAAARAVGYVNAGTVEFVLDTGGTGGGDPYFLEMNTRLQVEHPVTEEVTGLDLVRLQLLVAAGVRLPDDVHAAVARGPVGHAIEARLYAEDPAAGWLPSTGDLHEFSVPTDRAGIRVDSGVESGGVVSPHYDPMLAKVVAHAPTRGEATSALAAALAGSRIHGVTTNRDLLVRTLRHPAFDAGATDTGFLDRHGLDRLARPLADEHAVGRHAVAAALAGQAGRRAEARVLSTLPSGWRNNTVDRQEITFDSGSRALHVAYRLGRRGRAVAEVVLDGEVLDVTVGDVGPTEVVLTAGGVARRYAVQRIGATTFVDGPDGASRLVEEDRHPVAADQVGEGSSLAPMPGNVVRVAVSAGDRVEAGQVLVVLEAMKMEHAVHAGTGGTVVELGVAEGDQVETGRVLVVVESDEVPGDGAAAPVGRETS